MARDHDKEDGETLAQREPAGKVEFDSRGKAIWRWARDVLDSTSILLKRLENKDLALEPTRKVPVMRSGHGKPAAEGGRERSSRIELSLSGPESRDGAGGGFDPYNSGR